MLCVSVVCKAWGFRFNSIAMQTGPTRYVPGNNQHFAGCTLSITVNPDFNDFARPDAPQSGERAGNMWPYVIEVV